MNERVKQFLEVKGSIERDPFAKKNITAAPSRAISYVQYRILRPLFKWRYHRFQKKHPDYPWLCPDAIKALEILLKGGKGIEYGSGRSTLFFAQLLDELHSIEHHLGWSEKVNQMLLDHHMDHVHLHYIPADQVFMEPKLSSEEQFFLSEEDYPIKDDIFSTYVKYLDKIAEESIDFILVDGRARKSCCQKAMSKLRTGGILVLDNSERVRYQSVIEDFSIYPSIFTSTGLTDTTIWLKT
jgi:hypothetical protein